MADYIIDEEAQLSPVVVVSTAILAAAFLLGILYQAVLVAI